MIRYKNKTKEVKSALVQHGRRHGRNYSDEKIASMTLYDPKYHGRKVIESIDWIEEAKYVDVLKTERKSILIVGISPCSRMFMFGDTVFIHFCSKGFPYMSFWSEAEKILKEPIPLRKAMGKEEERLLFATFRYPKHKADWAETDDCIVIIPRTGISDGCMCVQYPQTRGLTSLRAFPIFCIGKADSVLSHPDFQVLD